MSEFALQVPDIDETGKDYSFDLTRSWLDQTLADANLRADPKAPEGTLEVHAQKNGTEYLVEGRVRAALITECCRCLGPAAVPVDTRFATLFFHRAGAASGPAGSGKKADGRHAAGHAQHEEVDETFDADDDELAREPFTGHEIALDSLIREYLVLECPMQALCADTCEGITVPEHVRPPEDVFGSSDTTVDPRLAPLLRLRDKVPPNKE